MYQFYTLQNKKCSSYNSTLPSIPNGDPNALIERKKRLPPESNALYEIKNCDDDNYVDNIAISPTTVVDNLGFINTIDPPSCNNQSTPKKQSFTTKVEFFVESY